MGRSTSSGTRATSRRSEPGTSGTSWPIGYARADSPSTGCWSRTCAPYPRSARWGGPRADEHGPHGAYTSVERSAAGSADHLAVDVLGFLGGEEDIERRELAGLARAPKRRVAAELGVLVGGKTHGHERRPDRAGRDRVDADAALGDLLREAFRERADGALGRGVVQELWAGLRGLDRCGVDDRRP